MHDFSTSKSNFKETCERNFKEALLKINSMYSWIEQQGYHKHVKTSDKIFATVTNDCIRKWKSYTV